MGVKDHTSEGSSVPGKLAFAKKLRQMKINVSTKHKSTVRLVKMEDNLPKQSEEQKELSLN